jgi:NAD(P)H-dependent FMN reductase
MTFHVLALSGSLRSGSSNTGLIMMCQRLAPTGLQIEYFPEIALLPYYNADLDQPGAEPESVARFRQKVRDTDAVLMATPEYNGHLPAVLKNAFDWVSKPNGAHALTGKVITSMSSAGGGGGGAVLKYLNTVLPYFGNTVVTEPVVELKKGADYVTADGTSSDASVEALVSERLANLLAALEAR